MEHVTFRIEPVSDADSLQKYGFAIAIENLLTTGMAMLTESGVEKTEDDEDE